MYKTIAFPSYNGNAMFLSTGNISGHSQVGLLFIDLEKPHRMRVQGSARVSSDDPLIGTWKEAELVVAVTLSEVFQNCPRYVHPYQKVKESRYVPKDTGETPVAGWKHIDAVQKCIAAERAPGSGARWRSNYSRGVDGPNSLKRREGLRRRPRSVRYTGPRHSAYN